MSAPVQLDGRFVTWMSRLNAGEASLPDCEGSRHHYVPQFLLKRFRGGGRLYELDKQTGEIVETTPKDAAWDNEAGGPNQPPHLRLGDALRVRAFTRPPRTTP